MTVWVCIRCKREHGSTVKTCPVCKCDCRKEWR